VGAAQTRKQILVYSGCGQQVGSIAETYEREVRDLPCFEYRTSVVIELYRLRCPNCGVKTDKAALLPHGLATNVTA
jgi:transposase